MKVWILLALAGVIIGGAAWAISRGIEQLDTETTTVLALADEAASRVSNTWAPADLEPFAWDGYYAKLEQEKFSAWDTYRALGARRSLESCSLVGLNITNGLGNAMARCAATFERGSAKLVLTMSNHTGPWRVTNFKIEL